MARTYLTQLKGDAAIIKSIATITPNSPSVTAYIKNLNEMKTDLTAKDRYFHHGSGDLRRGFKANVDARKMGREIDQLLQFLGQ